MATKTGESGEESATILNNNTGIATTAGPLAESSTSSSSSASSSSSTTTTTTTVILTESTATSTGNLPLTGSQQQSLHQVQQPATQQPTQQEAHQKVSLITDVAADDVAGKSMILTCAFLRLSLSLMRAACRTSSFLSTPPISQLHSRVFPLVLILSVCLLTYLSLSFFPFGAFFHFAPSA